MRRQTLLTGVRMAATTALVSNGQIQGIVAFGLVSLLFGAAAALVGGLRRLILLLVVYGVQGQHHLISNDYYNPLLRMTSIKSFVHGVFNARDGLIWGDREEPQPLVGPEYLFPVGSFPKIERVLAKEATRFND